MFAWRLILGRFFYCVFTDSADPIIRRGSALPHIAKPLNIDKLIDVLKQYLG